MILLLAIPCGTQAQTAANPQSATYLFWGRWEERGWVAHSHLLIIKGADADDSFFSAGCTTIQG